MDGASIIEGSIQWYDTWKPTVAKAIPDPYLASGYWGLCDCSKADIFSGYTLWYTCNYQQPSPILGAPFINALFIVYKWLGAVLNPNFRISQMSMVVHSSQGISHWKNQWGRRSLMSWRSCSGHGIWKGIKVDTTLEKLILDLSKKYQNGSLKSNRRRCEVVVWRTEWSNGLAGATCVSPESVVGGSWRKHFLAFLGCILRLNLRRWCPMKPQRNMLWLANGDVRHPPSQVGFSYS